MDQGVIIVRVEESAEAVQQATAAGAATPPTGEQIRQAIDLARQQAREQAQQAREQATIAREEAVIAREQARIAVEEARREALEHARESRVVVVPPGAAITRPGPDGPSEGTVMLGMGLMIMLAVIAIGTPLARAWGRRIERRGAVPAAIPADLGERLARIEQSVDAIALEVERISEAQRFVARLQAERGAPALGAGAPAVPTA